jgi:NAD(P)-dependent dehydrogenase (short-subunit alcohol dehydrogenase family)
VDVANRIALVTGAAGGIGRASALALARAGAAAVAVADIDVEGGEETAALIRAAGADSQFVKTDVGELGQLRSLFGTVQDRFGLPAIVHNNAGLVCGQPEWPETSIERIHQMVNVNFGAMAIGTRLAVDAMSMRGGGAIVNTASVAALSPMPNDPVYAATKAGVVMFTQSCAALRDRGIRVNAVLPGMVDTAIIAKTGDGEKPAEWLRPMLDLVVLLRPEDVARAVLSLVEDDSKAGETMLVMNEFVQPAQS